MLDPRGDYCVVQGALTFAKRENFEYPACSTCNKKVYESGGTYTCETCQKTLDSSGVSHRSGTRSFSFPVLIVVGRYILSACVGDHTGTVFVSVFNEVAEQLFGMSAAELTGLKDSNTSAFDDKFTRILYKVRRREAVCHSTFFFLFSNELQPGLFKLRSKVDERSDDHRVRFNVVSLPPFSFTEDTAVKLHEIRQYLSLAPPASSTSSS